MPFHIAYTFDADGFHYKLAAKAVREGQLDQLKLQKMAISVMETATDDIKRILTDMKYDDDWLDDPDKDQSQAYLWYMVNLATVFNPCPSLSNNRFRGSYYVLEKVLPIVNWSKTQVQELIWGKFLKSLLTTTEYADLFHNISIYGGCLNINDSTAILSHFTNTRENFLNPSVEMLNTIDEYAAYNQLSPIELLNLAYLDTLDMLHTAIHRNEALYLLLYT